jgi:tRNA-dihydrouridine synthase
MVLGEIYSALDQQAFALEPTLVRKRYRPLSVAEHLARMAEYAEREMMKGERLHAITRHLLGLLSHTPGAREYRRLLSEGARESGAGPELIRRAANLAVGEAA